LNWRLSQLIVTLVGVQLFVEIIFACLLVYSVNQAELILAQQEHAKQIISSCQEYASVVYECGMAFELYRQSLPNGRGYITTKRISAIDENIFALKEELKGDSAQLARVDRLEHLSQLSKKLLQQAQSVVDRDPIRYLPMEAVFVQRFLAVTSQTLPCLFEISENAKLSLKDIDQNKLSSWQSLRIVVLAGLVINALFSCLVIWLVLTKLSKRLAVLVTNTELLAVDKPLNPELGGKDELSMIDKSFHKMAVTMHDAAQKERDVEEMKRQFVAMVSHELRTPLTSINGLLYLLAKGNWNAAEPIKDRAGKSGKELTRVISLVEDLLSIEQLESGNMQLVPDLVTIEAIFDSAVTSVATVAEQRHVQVKVEPCSLSIEADPRRIIQVVINLLSNAIKFSPENGVVWLSCHEENGFAVLSVKDEGRGIPADKLESIFDRFHQVEIGDAQQKGGIGLGLSICRGIVEAHGGTISVESAVGKGSTFCVRLPMTFTAVGS